MTAWFLALWGRVPPGARRVLAAIGAAIAAGFALFFMGQRRGRREGVADARMDAARGEAQEIRDKAAAGDDAGVQTELAKATEKARRRKR